jgi:hypothetical protein
MTWNFDHFSKWNSEFTHLKNHIYFNNAQKKHWCTGENLNIYQNKLQKNSLKNPLTCKSYFWEKGFEFFSQSNPFGKVLIGLDLSHLS